MITQKEILKSAYLSLPIDAARSLWIERVSNHHIAAESILALLLHDDWETVEVAEGEAITADGRAVLRIGPTALALRVEEHERRLVEAFAQDTPRSPPAPKPGESLTSVLCPSCRAVMAKAPVCPNCAKGKAGYKILCQCTECAHEVYL